MRMKILVTGFDPFGGEEVNPAYEAVKLLPAQVAGAEVITEELPTIFGKCAEVLEELIEKHSPDVVLCVGQAGGRSGISLEKVAINLTDASMPDNAGNRLAVCIQPFVYGTGEVAHQFVELVNIMRDALVCCGTAYQYGQCAGSAVFRRSSQQ